MGHNDHNTDQFPCARGERCENKNVVLVEGDTCADCLTVDEAFEKDDGGVK